MVAWFKSDDANPVWKSAVGAWQGRVTKGSVTRKVEAGNGATRPVGYLAGDSNAGYDFGKIMKPDFTICSISRYVEGGRMGRILQAGHPNFLHGHHAQRAGVAYYNAGVTSWDVPSSTDWLVMCGNNKGVVYVGNERRNIAIHHGVLHGEDFHLYINEGFTEEVSDFGVMEVITWNRALSDYEMWTSMEYLNWKLQEILPHHPAAESSMVAWFKSEDARPVWKSAVGSWQGRVTKGSVTRKVEPGNGATRPVAYLAGDPYSGYDFGKIMKPDFTICSISRYVEGGRMGRILQTGYPNFLHGHHHHATGVAYYSAWVTPWDLPSNTDWLVMCGSNKGVVYVGNERRNIAVHHGVLHNADFNLYINEGWNGQESDFGVMEVITWNRALSEDEMWTSMEYLNWKLQAHLAHQPSAESSMVAWFKSEDAGPAWKSAVGSWQARVTKGSVTRRFNAGSGAAVPVAHLTGLTNAGLDFGKIMKPEFTICSITRYLAGGIHGRILQSGHHPNFLHGHWSRQTGVAYYHGWVTPHLSPSSTDWLVMCGNNKGVVFVGKDGKNIATGHGPQLNADFHLYINEGFANEASDFGVMEVITWNRALSEDEMWTSMEYLNWKIQAAIPYQPAGKLSMVAWFKSEDASPAWRSAVGSWQARVTKGSITRKVEAGNGATKPVGYLAGDSNAGYDFGKIMKPDFTICSITRYVQGGRMGRILQNIHPNFLHGHHGHRTGVAHYSTWVTPWDVPSNTDWLVMCGNNKGVVYVGNEQRNIAVHHGVLHSEDFNLYINEGFTGEVSDFGVMEVITWNRALSEDEMWTSMEYLNWKLATGTQ